MLSVLFRPFFVFLVIVSYFIGWFFGAFPPNLQDATTFGKISAFIGTVLIMVATPTMAIYFRYRAHLKALGFSIYAWKTVQFSLSASVIVAIVHFIGVQVLPLGYLAVLYGIAMLAYLCMASAINLLEKSFSA